MCGGKNHKYRKFDDRSVFCARCGDQRFLSSGSYYRPWWPNHTPYWTTPWYGGGTAINVGSTAWAGDMSNVTYTAAEEVNKDTKPIQGQDPTKKTIKGTIEPETKK
jgi:hypothetical protein